MDRLEKIKKDVESHYIHTDELQILDNSSWLISEIEGLRKTVKVLQDDKLMMDRDFEKEIERLRKALKEIESSVTDIPKSVYEATKKYMLITLVAQQALKEGG